MHCSLTFFLRRCTRLLWDPKILLWSVQGWEFAQSLIAHLVKIAHFNEPLWGICSECSGHVSGCERIAQVSHDKRTTVSKSLRSLMTKEQLWANRSGRSWQKSDREQFAQVDHVKRANEGIIIFFSKLFISIFAHKKQAICQKNLEKIIFLFVL